MNFTIALDKLLEQIQQLKQDLIKQVELLPDNKDIIRDPKYKRMFFIKRSKLRNDWSPSIHDFVKQYEEVVHMLENCKTSDVIGLIDKAINSKRITSYKRNYVREVKLHPEVCRNLRKLIGDNYASTKSISANG